MGIVYYSSKTTVLADLLFSKTKVNHPSSSSEVYNWKAHNVGVVYIMNHFMCLKALVKKLLIST